MARYFIRLSYDGTNYHGWQIQDNAQTVQGQVNKALGIIFEQDIACTGCGRTDTGVHASGFYAHFDVAAFSDSGDDIVYKLNGCLPVDIAIDQIYLVDDEANSRFDAVSRSYTYHIITKKNVFAGAHAYFHYKPVDVNSMNRCAGVLLKHTDFSCFSRSNTQTKTNNCDIIEAKWTQDKQRLDFDITANRFLRGMVRAIVGTMLEVGAGKLSEADFTNILESKDRTKAGFSVPAQGLFLSKVLYPDGYFGK